VQHKTGWIGEVVYHDAAIVRPARGAAYVLVVLTGGIREDRVAYELVADLSHLARSAVPGADQAEGLKASRTCSYDCLKTCLY